MKKFHSLILLGIAALFNSTSSFSETFEECSGIYCNGIVDYVQVFDSGLKIWVNSNHAEYLACSSATGNQPLFFLPRTSPMFKDVLSMAITSKLAQTPVTVRIDTNEVNEYCKIEYINLIDPR